MAHRGGLRPGAGRPKGTRNKRTEKQRKATEEGGQTPLDFLLSVMRDDKQGLDDRIDAAKAAAPYVHSRLASVELAGKGGGNITVEIVRFAEEG